MAQSNASPSTDLSTLTARTHLPAELANASGMAKLEWILALPAPDEFVTALAPDELYFWLCDIGKNDAYPLLEYATQEQLQSLVDIDAWNRHELSIPRWLGWLDLAQAVDDATAERFLAAQGDELMTWLFSGDIQVLPADTDIDAIPDELQFVPSPDGMYIVTVPREHPLEERLPKLMRLLWSADMDRARALFQQVQFELHASAQDELERFRGARLQDLGFEPPTEALAVYSVIPIGELKRELTDARDAESDQDSVPSASGRSGIVTDLVLRGVEPPDLLRAAVSALDPRDRVTFGNGFAYLANKVLMAESGDLSRLEDLPEAARQAAALANLGLSYLAAESEERAAVIVRQVAPETLFKAGWTLAFNLRKQAARLAHRAGYSRGYALFGAPNDEVITAAAELRPRVAEVLDDGDGFGTKPLATLDQLSRVEARIQQCSQALDAFERHFGLTLDALEQADMPGVDPDAKRRVRLSTLVRTGLLHLMLEDEFRFAPVTREQLAAFSSAAFKDDASITDALAARAAALVDAHSGDDDRGVLADLVQRALDELVETLAPVRPDDVDLRYAGELFIVAGDATH